MTDTALLYTGKIKKVFNKLCAFAEVTLRLDTDFDGLAGVSLDPDLRKSEYDILPEYEAAAVMGVCFALRMMEVDHVHFTVVGMRTVLTDTTPTHVMAAAAFATFTWGDPDWEQRYSDEIDMLIERVRESHQNAKANFHNIPMLYQ